MLRTILGYGVVAGLIVGVGLAGLDFGGAYADAQVAAKKAAGASGAELAKFTAEMEAFKVQYADPLFRLPMTFMEIFPVGVLVSAISAGLLRNPRFMAVRRE